MKLTRPRKIAIVIVITAIIAPAAFAILGLGDIVFDPTNFGKLVEQLAQMQQQYTQLVQTYQVVTAQYNQMICDGKDDPGQSACALPHADHSVAQLRQPRIPTEPREDGSPPSIPATMSQAAISGQSSS